MISGGHLHSPPAKLSRVHHRPTCCFSISNASQATLWPATGKGVTNLFHPSPYCYIVAATSLLLHHCCYITAAISLLLHPTKTHFLGPAVPTTPSHLIHSRATLSVTISTDCVYSQLSHTLHSGLTLAPWFMLASKHCQWLRSGRSWSSVVTCLGKLLLLWQRNVRLFIR